MLYVSLDIETSGLDHKKNKILSIGAIIEDTENKLPFDECPKFNVAVLQNEFIGSPRAITINKELISLIADYQDADDETRRLIDSHGNYKYIREDEVAKEFYWFLYYQGIVNGGIKDGEHRIIINGTTKPITINVAGKNFGTFDKLFLQELPWWEKLIHVRQRLLDPAILMVDWVNDISLPNLYRCKQRAGIDGVVTHDALEDAWDVIEVLRKFY